MTRTVQRIFIGAFMAVLLFCGVALGFEAGQVVISKIGIALNGLAQGKYTAAVVCLLAAGGFGGGVYAFQDWLTDGNVEQKGSTFIAALAGLWAYPGVVCAALLTYYGGVPVLHGTGAAGMVVAVTAIVSGMLFAFITLGLLFLAVLLSRKPQMAG